MGRSEPGGEKEREVARMATMVILAGRREEHQANDWRTFNEKSIKQAQTGLFIQNLCETEHQRRIRAHGIFILEFRRDLGRLYKMAPVWNMLLIKCFAYRLFSNHCPSYPIAVFPRIIAEDSYFFVRIKRGRLFEETRLFEGSDYFKYCSWLEVVP